MARPLLLCDLSHPVCGTKIGLMELKPIPWDFIQHWADEPIIGHKLFNVGSTIDLTYGFVCP